MFGLFLCAILERNGASPTYNSMEFDWHAWSFTGFERSLLRHFDFAVADAIRCQARDRSKFWKGIVRANIPAVLQQVFDRHTLQFWNLSTCTRSGGRL